MNMSGKEPKSWGEALRNYESSKKSLSWEPNEVQQVQKLNCFERRTLERELDPILMQFRDPKKEKDFSETLQATVDRKKTKGQAGQDFNIINHKGPPRKNVFIGTQKSRDQREWNLLSHFPEKLHKKAPLEFNEELQILCTKRRSILDDLNVSRGREFNILSNKFNENDTSRRLEDHMKTQDHLRNEYERTRIYDPIKVQAYDIDKEKDWQLEHKEKLAKKRALQEERIPQTTKFAEGNTYNILTTEVTNADRLMQKPNRTLNRYKGRAEKVNASKIAGDERATIQENRRMNRVSYDRWEKTIDRGYDFVFGGPVELNPLPKPQPSIWDRLHTDVQIPQTSGTNRTKSFRTKDLSNANPSSDYEHEPQHLTAQPSGSASDLPSGRSNSNTMKMSKSMPTVYSNQKAPESSQATRRENRVPQLDLGACPSSPVSYTVPKNSLPGQPITMVRTGGGLSSYD